jgi:CHASE2 domain-containing sensor protein
MTPLFVVAGTPNWGCAQAGAARRLRRDMNVFISYRRLDGNLQALLVHKELQQRLPADTIFMDVKDIGWGDDFVHAIDAQLAHADVVILIVGKQWLQMLQARERGDDWVRHEVTTALRLRAASLAAGRKAHPRVLPLLVDGAPQLDRASLPDALKALAGIDSETFDEHASERSLNEIVNALRNDKPGDDWWRRVAFHASLAVGALLALASLTSLLDVFGLDTRARTLTLALASVGRDAAALPWSDRVVWVAIDADAQTFVKRPLDESWRQQHAQVIEIAKSAGARALAFDLTFEDAGPPEADAALERALRAAQPALPVAVAVQSLDAATGRPKLLPRFAALVQAALGCAGQRNGLAVSLPLAALRGGADLPQAASLRREAWLPSLALAAWSGNGAIEQVTPTWSDLRVRVGERSLDVPVFLHSDIRKPTACPVIAPGDRVAQQWLDGHALPPLDRPPRRVSLRDVLERKPAALEALRGRIALVGIDLPGDDRFGLPGRQHDRAGAELFVAQIDALERGASVRSPSALAQGALLIALALCGRQMAAMAMRRCPAARYPALLAGCVVLLVISALVYRSSGWLVAVPYAALALLAGGIDWRTWWRKRYARKRDAEQASWKPIAH